MNAAAGLLTLMLTLGADDSDLTVLSEATAGVAPAKVVEDYLVGQARLALDRRRRDLEKIATPEACRAYQERLRSFFVQQLGGFPERTPLNAQVVGKISEEGYRIEKVVFESQPDHHVTATLYLPDADPPFPGVVVASGHSRTGKGADYNQRFGIIMAKHGMAALCYDPIGQGERSQILTADGEAKHRSTTHEHFMIGVGSILVGANTATYRVWDGMRAIDYLQSRPEIDASKIGMTGCSGGGTLTSYVMALDDRVACAAPACYLTTFARLLDTIGPQDAEQNIFGQIAFGMDQPDYVIMRAPQPTIISSTTGDFFDITGSWDNLRQAKRFYAQFGHPERVDLVEGPGGHGVPMGNLVGIARWMRRWLLGKDDALVETSIPARPLADLQCTPNGQVLLMPGERSVFDLNVEREKKLARQRGEFWANATTSQRREKVRELAGIRPLADLPQPKVRKLATVARPGYRIDKLVLEPQAGLLLPALVFVPREVRGDVVLFLHGSGKRADAGPGGAIEKLVAKGHLVMAVDLPGIGETRGDRANRNLGDWKNYYIAYLLGKSYVGLRAEQAVTCARYLAGYESGAAPMHVRVIGSGEAAIAALHAAALEPDLIASVQLQGMIKSWIQVVGAAETENQLVNTVHGALRYYDLPNLSELASKVRDSEQ